MRKIISIPGVLFCLGLTSMASGGNTSAFPAFERAEALLPANLRGLVLNENVQVHWSADSSYFWYRRETGHGVEYVIIKSDTGDRSPAFDHERLAAAA